MSDAPKKYRHTICITTAHIVELEGERPSSCEQWIQNSADVAALHMKELLGALKRVGCQDAGSCGPTEADGRCFVCAAIAKANATPTPTKPPLKLNARKFHGVEWAPYVLAKAKEVARKSDWLLERWCVFSERARACFTAAAAPEEREKFLGIVNEHFTVTTYVPRVGGD